MRSGLGLGSILALASLGVSYSARPGAPSRERFLATVGPHRLLEARLTGEIHHQACEPVSGAEMSIPAATCPALPLPVRKAAARQFRALDDLEPTAERLHLAGLTFFVGSDRRKLDEPIQHLEQARELAPQDPGLANDLAALYLERAAREQKPEGLLAALELLGLMFDNSPTPELAFNRALVLEKLHLVDHAAEAWAQFIGLEPTGPWAEEARERLRRLVALLYGSPPRTLLRESAARGDLPELRRLSREQPQAAREVALFEILGSWGRAWLGGQAEAAELLAAARAIGEQLVAAGGEHSVLEAVEAIEGAASPALRRRLARAHRDLAEAQGLLEARTDDDSTLLTEAAGRAFRGTGSPAAAWVEVVSGARLLHGNRLAEAAALFQTLAREYPAGRYPALHGRALWGLGLVRFRQGLFEQSLAAQRRAASAFEKAREPANQGACLGLSAETLQWMGDAEVAWRERYRALAQLASEPAAKPAHNVLWEASDAALAGGFPHSAGLFGGEDVRRFGEGPDPLLAGEAHFRRALALRRSGHRRQALAGLSRAAQRASRVRSRGLTELIQAELRLEQLFRFSDERRRESARSSFERSIAWFRAHGQVVREGRARLERAQIALEQGRPEEAEADLFAALDLFERNRRELRRLRNRRDFAATWQPVFDELLALTLSQGRPALARRVFEAGLGTPLKVQPPAPSELPAGLTVLEIAAHPDFLAFWQLDRGGWQATTKPLAALERQALAEHFTATAATRGSTWEEAFHAGQPLSEVLLPQSLPTAGRLCIVTERELAGIPFAALPHPATGRPLVESLVLSLADSAAGCVASAQAWTEKGLQPDSRTLLLVQPPAADLRYAEQETADLAGLYPDLLALTGLNATPSALLEALPRIRILHYAGHAFADARRPELSRLPLVGEGEQGTLTAESIEELSLTALELAILAGCTTFTHRPERPESLTGLGRAFLDAGAKAVLGTLWNVDDKATRKLMFEFHRELRNQGDPAVALATAQQRMLAFQQPDFTSPAAWAGISVVGVSANPPHSRGTN